MKTQEVFDKVAVHLLTQGEPSLDKEGGNCAYRTGSLSCAVGCLIPEELYNQQIEGVIMSDVIPDMFSKDGGAQKLQEILNFLKIHTQDYRLLGELQDLHDNGSNEIVSRAVKITEWKNELFLIAESYGLDSKVLNDFRN